MDAVITVSPVLSQRLQRENALAREPTVVLNAPPLSAFDVQSQHSIRAVVGVERDVPLVVYSGNVKPERGVETLVRALPSMPGVHCAVVARVENPTVVELKAIAAAAGCGHRLHVVPYVPADKVSSYLSTADVGVHTIRRSGNADIALPNKMFEYFQALLPMVVSDAVAMAAFMREHGTGEVFSVGDAEGLAQACLRVLENRDTYRRRIADPEFRRRYCWETQAEALSRLYAELLPMAEPDRNKPAVLPSDRSVRRLGIGPNDREGQAIGWARALSKTGNVEAEVFSRRGTEAADVSVVSISKDEWNSLNWQLRWMRRVAQTYSHVLLEDGDGILGGLNGGRLEGDISFLRARGVAVGVVHHITNVRDPMRFAESEPFDPYGGPDPRLAARQQKRAKSTRRQLERFDGPVFVTSVEALDYLPRAAWLPIVFQGGAAIRTHAPLSHGRTPILLRPHVFEPKHVRKPIRQALNALELSGALKVRPCAAMPTPAEIASADIVLASLTAGEYGPLVLQALAANRVVLGNVSARTRARLGTILPVVQTRPETLGQTIEEIIRDPLPWQVLAMDGPGFVRETHSPEAAVRALAPLLSLRCPAQEAIVSKGDPALRIVSGA